MNAFLPAIVARRLRTPLSGVRSHLGIVKTHNVDVAAYRCVLTGDG